MKSVKVFFAVILLSLLKISLCAGSILNTEVEKWNLYEITLKGPSGGNPFEEVRLSAVFFQGEKQVSVDGFYDGKGIYKIRFMPEKEGEWKYRTSSNYKKLDGKEGSFICISPGEKNHGPVRVKNTFHFAYADGQPYYPVGTTVYALTQMDDDIVERTLKSLENSPFNKLRMLVFPKQYEYFINHEPPLYPFEGSKEEGWDFSRFNPEYFQRLENTITELHKLGIQVDLILFHPYDWGKWGFDNTPLEADKKYLKYLLARLSSFQNIWWSMANEYDLIQDHSTEDWEELAECLMKYDPYKHLRSIHNAVQFYDHSKDWITHVSIQNHSPERIVEWREKYHKPVIVDECSYEGDVEFTWGDITAEEMTNRFWKGYTSGGYVSHGEVYLNKDTLMFWAEGGEMVGESPERIGFLRKIMEEGPEYGVDPLPYEPSWNRKFKAGKEPEYYIHYFGESQPKVRIVNLPEEYSYSIEIIDAWNMTIQKPEGEFSGKVKVALPGKKYIALRIKRIR